MPEEDIEYLSKRETSRAEDQHEQLLQTENWDLPVVTRNEEEGGVKIVKYETLVKQELDETETDSGEIPINEKLLTNGRASVVEQLDTKEDSLVGKLKVRPFALLAEPIHLTPSFPQANLRTDSYQNAPQAPVNLTFPHSRKVHFHTETPESKENITNNGSSEIQVYLRNQNLQLVSYNYRCPDLDNFPNMPPVPDRPLLMQFPAPSVSSPRDIPTTSISISNSYVPLNIPSVRPMSFLQSSISEQKHVSSENMASSLALENATMSSGPTYCQVKEEIKIEKTDESPETTATEVPITNSTSNNMNMIVKAELDLGVTILGDDPGQPNLNNLNNLSDYFMASDSICSRKQLRTWDPYHDVDPEDLKPRSKPNGKRLCRVCDFHHDSMVAMEKHMEKLHSAKYNYRCFICTTYEFPSFGILEYHVATVHRGEKRFQCSKCDKIYKTRKSVMNHKAKVHKCTPVINPFACHLCRFTCKKLSTLENHSSTHNETSEECPVCLRMIKQSRMKEHMGRHSWRSDPRNKRGCGKCNFATTSIALLRKHFNSTLHNREFHCQLCKYATHFEEDFKKHTMSCNKNNPYVCTFPSCDKIFYVERQYITHSRIHLFPKMKLYKCVDKDCDFQSLAKCNLVAHLKKTKHNLPFKCPDCTRRYSKEELVASHILKVHVENIIQQQGLALQVEDHDSNVAVDQNYTDVGIGETDPYAHFKKGWLGISCLEEEDNMAYQPSDTLNTGAKSFSAAEAQLSKCQLPNGEPEFTHVVPEISCMVECSHETSDCSDQTHSNIKLDHEEVHSDTELHENITVTPSIDLMNSAIDSGDKTSMNVVNYNPGVCDKAVQVDDFTIKTDPELLCSPPIERGDNIIFTPSSNFVLNHTYADKCPITPNHSGDSYFQVDAFSVKPEPDSSDNVVEAPSVLFPGMQSQDLETECRIDYIQSDPKEFLVDLNFEV